jgi:hypothetical protein
MGKMLKTIALLLVIAAVVFVAGCANKNTSNVTQGASEQVTAHNPVSSEGVTESEVKANVPANISVTGNSATNVNEATENNTSTAVSATPSVKKDITEDLNENNTSTASTTPALNIEQTTGNTTAANGVIENSVKRHQAVAQSQQQSDATVTVKK